MQSSPVTVSCPYADMTDISSSAKTEEFKTYLGYDF